MNKPLLKINYSDFWKGFDKTNNLFSNLLTPHFELEISETPDVLIYSCFGYNFRNYKCHRIFYTGENVKPNYFDCDFSLTFYHDTFKGRNLRLPLYMFSPVRSLLNAPKDPDQIYMQKSKFCNIVVSNSKCPTRNKFFHLLNSHKRVDSGGKYLNNIGGPVKNKLDFISQYKFTLAFENKSTPGYVTEKLIEPMMVNSIPIYWGDTEVSKDFNQNSFINAHNFSSFNELAKYIIEVDNNEKLYKQIIQEPYLLTPGPLCQDYTYLSNNLKEIVESLRKVVPVHSKLIRSSQSTINIFKKRVLVKTLKIPYWQA